VVELNSNVPLTASTRDPRIDFLRGLAMICVIVNHSKMSSLLSWFSYERFWVVTGAEVFVVLSGVVLGMVYGRRLNSGGWRPVIAGLSRRALLLYGAFVGVTLSVVLLSAWGVDVGALAREHDRLAAWILDPHNMDAAAWRDLFLMRSGPWTFEIVALYVWLVVAAVPCLFGLRLIGWLPVLGASWIVYLGYRIAPVAVTGGEFETVFPILAWQLLFVHGITIGYHRDRIAAWVRQPRVPVVAAAGLSTAFLVFALCNPWVDGPSWLHLRIVSSDRFADLYVRYFGLSELGIGRLLNLAVALPTGYAVLGWCWALLRPIQTLFVALGRRSLDAFVLHVYGMLLLAYVPRSSGLVINTMLQLLTVVVIAALLGGVPRRRQALQTAPAPARQALAA
jgi:hypothetical protein